MNMYYNKKCINFSACKLSLSVGNAIRNARKLCTFSASGSIKTLGEQCTHLISIDFQRPPVAIVCIVVAVMHASEVIYQSHVQVSPLVTRFSAHFGLCHGYGENNSVIIQLQTLTVSHINADVSEPPSASCNSGGRGVESVATQLPLAGFAAQLIWWTDSLISSVKTALD